jgi:CHAT domain-containing protein/Flp pilus assembly protein TadD
VSAAALLMPCCGGLHDSPQDSFEDAYKALLHGDLKRAQDKAHQEGQRFQGSSPEWAWKFRTLEARAALQRGQYQSAIQIIHSAPLAPRQPDLAVPALTVAGEAEAKMHNFSEAEGSLDQAEEVCTTSVSPSCGYVLKARGVLATERNQLESAERLFQLALTFARTSKDTLLESYALLNLGYVSLAQGRFDESIDRSDAGYQLAKNVGARRLELITRANVGWDYYKLGDSEKALELFLEAKGRASQLGDVWTEQNELTNIGRVYMDEGKFEAAETSFRQALGLAQGINAKEDIYNALRVLAQLSLQTGDLANADKYSHQALDMARHDNNHIDELYPVLIQGQIAARRGDITAEDTFHKVERDKICPASMKWEAEHALARLYEDEGHPDAAEREYRTTLTTFEAARSSLQRNESKLPFSNNAASIYDDYIHFLVAQKKINDALRWADYSRARTLKEGLRKGSSIGMAPLNAQQISRRANGAILFYWLGETQSYLWTITPKQTAFSTLPPRSQIEASAQRYGKSLRGPQDARASSGQLPDPDGLWLYRTLIAPVQSLLKQDARVFVIPDGTLNNLNFETLIVDEPQRHFWIEDADVVNASSLRVLEASVLSASITNKKNHLSSMLLIGDSVSPSPEYPELPRAADQIKSVARHFPAAEQRIITREQATPEAYLDVLPEKFSYVHFVAHGTASRLSPLDSAIVLSKSAAQPDSFKLYARQIVPHTLHANLVTISSCYSAGDRAYSGEGLVGLAWAFLRAGAHNVIAGLWEVTDSSTGVLMDRFYGEIEKGASVDVALRTAKLSLLHSNTFHNPFYWAPFQLYTGS